MKSATIARKVSKNNTPMSTPPMDDANKSADANAGTLEPGQNALASGLYEIILDLLNFAALRRELIEGLDRHRSEERRQRELRLGLEQQYLTIVQVRNVARQRLAPSGDGSSTMPPGTLASQRELEHFEEDARIVLFNLDASRGRCARLADRIRLIEEHLDTVEAELVIRRLLLRKVSGVEDVEATILSRFEPGHSSAFSIL